MPKKAGTTMWRKQRRKEYLEKKEYRYYIFCEGEQTEPLYFEGFKQLIEDNPIYKDIHYQYRTLSADRQNCMSKEAQTLRI